MNLSLLEDGFLILLIGMGTVYFFIALMIWCMDGISKVMAIINKYFPEEVEEDISQKKKTSRNNDAEIALAIACAVTGKGRAC